MPGLRSGAVAPASGFACELGPLPDDVYALRGQAYAERVGLACAAQGALGGGGGAQRFAREGGGARIGACRAEILQDAAGGKDRAVMLPRRRADAAIAALYGAGAGYMQRRDIERSTGLSDAAASRAFMDALALGLIEPIDMAGLVYSPTARAVDVLALMEGAAS